MSTKMSASRRPLPRHVALGAEAHEVGQLVSLGVPINAEATERREVMHVKRLPDIGGCLAAVYAPLVALPGLAPRPGPRRAVVGLVPAAPVAAVFAARGSAIGKPLTVTPSATEPSARLLRRRAERLAARLAGCIEGGRRPAGDVRHVGRTGALVRAELSRPTLAVTERSAALRTVDGRPQVRVAWLGILIAAGSRAELSRLAQTKRHRRFARCARLRCPLGWVDSSSCHYISEYRPLEQRMARG